MNLRNMRVCDNNKINISNNFLLSMCPPVLIFLAGLKISNRQFLRSVLNLKSTINIFFNS